MTKLNSADWGTRGELSVVWYALTLRVVPYQVRMRKTRWSTSKVATAKNIEIWHLGGCVNLSTCRVVVHFMMVSQGYTRSLTYYSKELVAHCTIRQQSISLTNHFLFQSNKPRSVLHHCQQRTCPLKISNKCNIITLI
jgi:hypothetical protein